MYCHECRFCCTLSVCTTKKGSGFRFSNKSLNDAQERGSESEPTAAFGFLTDMRMYKNYDFRCLKPNPKIPSSKWGHYEMHGYRAQQYSILPNTAFKKTTILFTYFGKVTFF